ncbi:ophiophagus venom factor-like [Pocillopora damicornis]|uniref:ophiophagus venom factor-like n=1 Tax=Pocillopora damicornis TaxID=46731 RepID=UPI000F5575DC|nr:ophiophagus venom factor-like [Pocillopora damicornis]
MAELLGAMLRITVLLLALGCVAAKRFSIMAPNMFHIGVQEKVSVTVFDAPQPVTVKLYLQDYPHRQKTFSEVQGVVENDKSIFLPIKVDPQDLSDPSSVDKQYIYLIAKSDDGHFQFHKEAKILLSYKDGVVFIQTDKPVYTPRQSVKIRVMPLEFDMKPSRRKITVVVMNPQGVRVQQWKDLDTTTGIISKRLELGDFILHGNWTITAVYGHQNIHNTSVQFEVKEYVLPKFSVKVSVPPYILKTDDAFGINITARYTYGKPVLGSATYSLFIEGVDGQTIKFDAQTIILHSSGVTTVPRRIQMIRDLPGNIWFPLKARLLVQVDVVEAVTGNKATVEDRTCQFTSSPYRIAFKNTPRYFKPGLRYVVKAVVTYPNTKPAKNVPMLISAKGKQGNNEIDLKREDRDPNVVDLTDENGEVEFVVDACSICAEINIKVKTDNQNLTPQQNAVARLIVNPFDAENGPLIMVRQLTHGKVGRKIQCESYRSRNDAAAKLSFAVVSRGRIISHNTTDNFDGMFKSWSFRVTSEMSPSARLIGYYIDSNERVVADSILLRIDDKLPTEVEFPDSWQQQADGSFVQLNEVKKDPGRHYQLEVRAPQGTRLGLLSVDQSVYLLRNENRLTKDRIFKTIEGLDLGCGVGGGRNNKDIFKNAGVVLMTENFVSDGREDYGCEHNNARKKRSASKEDCKAYCKMGEKPDEEGRSCARRYIDDTTFASPSCRTAFWRCCKKAFGAEDSALLARNLDLGDDFGPSEEEILSQTQVRSFFPETWIYDEKVVGPDGLVQMGVTIPDTITTWVMQAVAINNRTGLGLATPLRILAWRPIFLSLKFPYSVKRGEQISILATVFNYHKEELRAKIYLQGDKDFCSTAADGKKAQIGIVDIPPGNARSVAVPIVPKRIGEISIEVSVILAGDVGGAMMNQAGDSVRRKLYVVPEGKETRKTQSFVLDPKGNLNDGPKSGDQKQNKPTAAPFQSQSRVDDNGQHDVINLEFPEKAIPGSVGAVVYVTGNLLGPVVNTTIEGGLERFITQPTGCGEQTMIRLAPNVYVLKYLMNTNQLTGPNEANAFRFIQSGYERELTYRRTDKAFSAWGDRTPGSAWLTAFVMRVFCEAQQFDGVNIDEEMVCQSVDWLVGNQRADGALPEVQMVYHREMVGGAYTEGEVAMTAFVLSALAECKCSGAASKASILRATDYLEKQYKNLNRPYSMSLTAYALALVNSKEKFNANDRLVQTAIYDNAKKSRYWNTGGNALDVETAGYALMTQVLLGRTAYAGPIVTYMTSQRQGGVGFVSTQDTVVALQALAMYSEQTAGNNLDLRVKLSSVVDGDWKPPPVHITPDNALLRRQFDIKHLLGGDLFVDTQGTGVGMLEVEVRYNVPSTRGESCKFDLNITVKEIKEPKVGNLFGPVEDEAADDNEKGKKNDKGGINRCKKLKGKKAKRKCRKEEKEKQKKRNKNKNNKNKRPPPKHQPVKSIHLKVCTRYKEKGNIGMSIMDIGILTGFKPDQISLNKLQDIAEVDKLEVSHTSLVVYLSEIRSDRPLCVDVRFDREYYVGVVQAVPVNVYDYYEPDQSCSKFYGPEKHSPLKLGVCEVGLRSCKCTQDECAQRDPPIGDVDKLINLACDNYNYVIKGKVLLIDEDGSMLNYVVEVLQVIQQGHKNLKVRQRIELKKRGSCQSPDMKENTAYLIMGLDKGGRYQLDKTAFVKLWPEKRDLNKDILEEFAQRYVCP